MTSRTPRPRRRLHRGLAALTAAGLAWVVTACGSGDDGSDGRASGPSASASGSSRAGSAKVSVEDDFNGDGYADLAIGAPDFTVGGTSEAGYVAVIYGSAHGLSAAHRTVISRATAGVPGGPMAGGGFGAALSRGDLDGDGYADLVIGSENHTDSVIVWGGRHGLSGATATPTTGRCRPPVTSTSTTTPMWRCSPPRTACRKSPTAPTRSCGTAR